MIIIAKLSTFCVLLILFRGRGILKFIYISFMWFVCPNTKWMICFPIPCWNEYLPAIIAGSCLPVSLLLYNSQMLVDCPFYFNFSLVYFINSLLLLLSRPASPFHGDLFLKQLFCRAVWTKSYFLPCASFRAVWSESSLVLLYHDFLFLSRAQCALAFLRCIFLPFFLGWCTLITFVYFVHGHICGSFPLIFKW